MMRKSIVFDKNTPNVFYCPQQKPTGFEKMIVNAKPLSRLCQFEGKPIPPDYKSDCYNDVDETEYACKEKYRIMVSHRWGHGPRNFSPNAVEPRQISGRVEIVKIRSTRMQRVGTDQTNKTETQYFIWIVKKELMRFSCISCVLR